MLDGNTLHVVIIYVQLQCFSNLCFNGRGTCWM